MKNVFMKNVLVIFTGLTIGIQLGKEIIKIKKK